MLFARELGRPMRVSVPTWWTPGLVNTDIGSKQTGGIVGAFWSLRKKFGELPDVVAQTYVYLCTASPAPEGLYFHACKESAYSPHADNAEDAKRLFELSEKLCGIDFGEGK